MSISSDDPVFDASLNLSLNLLRQLCASRDLLENASDFYSVLSKLNSNTTSSSVDVGIGENGRKRSNSLTSFDRPTPLKVWGVGLLFVTIISCCAAAGIALMPLLSRRTYRRLLIYFIGLGVGSLSGSAIFHLLPQAWGLVDSETRSHEYLNQAWMTISGIYLFFLVDKILKIIMEYRKRRKVKQNYKIQLPNDDLETKATELVVIPVNERQEVNGDMHRVLDHDGVIPPRFAHGHQHDDGETGSPAAARCLEPYSTESLMIVGDSTVDVLKGIQRMCSHDHEVHFEKGQSVIATVAWMIIFGDGLHNFIDGLSIGAAFTDSILSGISVSVAVLCEEFPHELGDVAILVSAGMTLRQALLYNLLSAATCYLGFFLGVVIGEFAAATTFIFALAGGMFLYISLGSMAPEMNATMEKSLSVSIRQGVLILILQSLGVFSGLCLMWVMSRYGPEIQFI